MRMEHKPMQNTSDDDLVLKFRAKTPQLPHKIYDPANNTSNLEKTKNVFEQMIQSSRVHETTVIPRTQPSPIPAWKQQRPKSDIYSDVYLEPGPEPEFCYAPKVKLQRKKSLVETLEENIEKKLEFEPARIPPGGVRLIPMKRDSPVVPQVQEHKPIERITPCHVEKEPELPKKNILAPPATPSKFVMGGFSDTNYESDFSDYSYFEKKFKHVAPPRPKSSEPTSNHNQPGPLKQMIQNGSPIPLTHDFKPALVSHSTTLHKSRPASGYFADTEDANYFSNSENRIYDQVGESDFLSCVTIIIFAWLIDVNMTNCKGTLTLTLFSVSRFTGSVHFFSHEEHIDDFEADQNHGGTSVGS